MRLDVGTTGAAAATCSQTASGRIPGTASTTYTKEKQRHLSRKEYAVWFVRMPNTLHQWSFLAQNSLKCIQTPVRPKQQIYLLQETTELSLKIKVRKRNLAVWAKCKLKLSLKMWLNNLLQNNEINALLSLSEKELFFPPPMLLPSEAVENLGSLLMNHFAAVCCRFLFFVYWKFILDSYQNF